MKLLQKDRDELSSQEWPTTLSIAVGFTITSTVLLLTCTSPEFSWDEAYRLPYASGSYGSIWSEYDLSHGPMTAYLAKLGQTIVPAWLASIEFRSRVIIAFVSSIGIGFLYWTLRYAFKSSIPAAFVGCSLLLFSFIRLEETNVIGPHHLVLAFTLVVAGLGYQWRNSPTPRAGFWLGLVIGLGALSTTYIVPVALWLAAATVVSGSKWISWDATGFKVSWAIPIALATTVIVVTLLWPAGVFRHLFLKDFLFYLNFMGHPTLVGDQIFAPAPRWAAAYWLLHLEAPLIMGTVFIIVATLWRFFKDRHLSSKHVYLMVFVTLAFGTAMMAHMAGARNLLVLVGVQCLAIGALFDEALNNKPKAIRFGSALVGLLAMLNLLWLTIGSGYIPYLATDGYRAFLSQNADRLSEKVEVLVYGLPILQYYAEQKRIPIDWDAKEMPWTPSADAPLSREVKYILMPEFVYRLMPAEQPMRHVVAEQWNVAWQFEANGVWTLRLYEQP